MYEWRSIDVSILPPLPTMLFDEERQLLFWCSKEQFTGQGVIVDAGAFLGASAACLAAGLRENIRAPEANRKVFSFDLFEWGEFYKTYLPFEELNGSEDTLPWIKKRWDSLNSLIVPRKGDMTASAWVDGGIEILFVDFTRHWQDHDYVIKNYYRNLIPGVSLLIHQDYHYIVCYWLHIFMEYYWDYFEMLCPKIGAASCLWKLKKPLPETAFESGLNEILTVDEMMALIDRSISRFDDQTVELLKVAKGRFILHALGPDEAIAYTDRLIPTIANPRVRLFASNVQKEAALYSRETNPYHGFFKYS